MVAEVETVSQVDIFTHERADLLEKLAMLAGCTTHREPSVGGGRKHGDIPYSNIMSAALVWWANHDDLYDSISGHILESLALQQVTHQDAILDALVRALADISARLAVIDRQLLRQAARAILLQCVYGVAAKPIPKMTARDWVAVDALATRTLWSSAEQGLRRMAKAMR